MATIGDATQKLLHALDATLTDWTQAERFIVGYSGGLDSSVLLHILYRWLAQKNLPIQLIAVHVNHGLNVAADAWQEHCQKFAGKLAVPLVLKNVEVAKKSSPEEAARDARYVAFQNILGPDDLLLLAHHSRDQAETFLLRAMRGSGVRGLAGIPIMRPLGRGHLLRPLLRIDPACLYQYAQAENLAWIEDDSNQDISVPRNYLRHRVLPRIESRWPQTLDALTRSTKHLREAGELLRDLGQEDLRRAVTGPRQISLAVFCQQRQRRRCNLLMTWFEQEGIAPCAEKTIMEIDRQITQGKSLMFRLHSARLAVFDQKLFLLKGDLPKPVLPMLKSNIWQPEQGDLELGYGCLQARASKNGGICVGHKWHVRLRTGGEKLKLRGQHRAVKKILQASRVPPWARPYVPLIYVDEELIAISDLAIADQYQAGKGELGWKLTCQPASDYTCY